MKSFRNVVKKKLKEQYPEIDLFWYDKMYEIMVEELHRRYKLNNCLCYNKRCKNRMV